MMDDVYAPLIQREPSARVPSETQLAQQLEAKIWANRFTEFESRKAIAIFSGYTQRFLNELEVA
jgi:hypothetical protein